MRSGLLLSGLLALGTGALAGAAAATSRAARPPPVAAYPVPLPLPDSAEETQAAAPPPALEAPAAPEPDTATAAASGPVRTDKLRLYGLMDREVVGPDRQMIGHVIDVLVDEDGGPEAVLVETGGFMGVGDRRIAVGWQDVGADAHNPGGAVHITMTTDQIRAAPAWTAGAPAFVAVGAPVPPPPAGPPPVASAPVPLPLVEESSAPLIAFAPAPLPPPAPRSARGRN